MTPNSIATALARAAAVRRVGSALAEVMLRLLDRVELKRVSSRPAHRRDFVCRDPDRGA